MWRTLRLPTLRSDQVIVAGSSAGAIGYQSVERPIVGNMSTQGYPEVIEGDIRMERD